MRNLEINLTNTIQNIVYDTDQKDAFFVSQLGEIVKKYNEWKYILPSVQPHYVLNCNKDPKVLSTLKDLESSFICSSKEEVQNVLSMGVNVERIIFSNPLMTSRNVISAQSNQLRTITFESRVDLEKIHKLYPKAKLIICAGQTHSKAEIKFGCNSINEFLHLLQQAKQLQLDVVGIKIHMYPGHCNASAISQIITTYLDTFMKSDFNLKLLDIGDVVSNTEDLFNLATEVRRLTNTYECFKKGSAEIIAEVGQFLVNNAYTLACKINNITELTNNANIHRIYHINYDKHNFISAYFDVPIVPKPLKAYTGKKSYSSSIWGPFFEDRQKDQIVENVILPEMLMGDWIIFENMGAYQNGTPESSGLDIFYVDNENCIYDLLRYSSNSMEEPTPNNDIGMRNNTSVYGDLISLSHYNDNAIAGNHRIKFIYVTDVDQI